MSIRSKGVQHFAGDCAGTTSIEYCLIAAAIALGVSAAVWHVGGSVAKLYASVGTAVGG